MDSSAPPSQPGTSTQTIVTPAGPPAAVTAAAVATGSRASATVIWSATPARASAAASASSLTTPMTVAAPARRAAAADSDPLLPAAPRIAVTGPAPPPACAAALTTRSVSAGAPHTSSTARDSGTGRSSGSTAAMDRPNRIAWPAQGTCSDRPSQRARPSVMASGVRLRETRVAIRSPGFRPSGESGPTSSTTPVSMPPEPVTGLCILPRRAMIPATAARTAAPSPPWSSVSWRNDAASRFSRSTVTRTSSGARAGLGSSRQAAWGSTPAGSATRCSPSADPASVPDRGNSVNPLS